MLLALSGHVDDVLPQYKVLLNIQSISPGAEGDMAISVCLGRCFLNFMSLALMICMMMDSQYWSLN
jgi:hypothetical protein